MQNLTFNQFINDLYNNIDRKIVYVICYKYTDTYINVTSIKYMRFSFIKDLYEAIKENTKSSYIFID